MRRPLCFERLEDRQMLATITVTSLAENLAVDGHVTLREAVRAAELNVSVDGSVAGNGADAIEFAAGLSGTVELVDIGDAVIGSSALAITSPITIRGNANGITILRSGAAPEMRLFRVSAGGSLRLESIMVGGGIAVGADGVTPGASGGSGRGGAIFNQGALEIVASTLYGHQAIGGDGAIGGSAGAGLGGAIFNDGGSVAIVNATLSDNLVDDGAGVAIGFRFGAGIYSRNGTLSISNSTITDSEASAGRGVYVLGDGATATVQIDSTIIGQVDAAFSISEFAAVDDNGGSVISSGDGNLIRWSLNFNGTVVNLDDPLLGPLASNGGPTLTHALSGNSPAVNTGINTLNLAVDQRGATFARVSGSGPDIGAFERQTVAGPALAGDYDGNLVVDAADYVVWRNTRDTDVAPFSGADGDGDGRIDTADYGVWRANFGRVTVPAAAATATVPIAAGELAVVEDARQELTPAPLKAAEPPVAPVIVESLTRAARPRKIFKSFPLLERGQLELELIPRVDSDDRAVGSLVESSCRVVERDGESDAGAIDQLLADWPTAF